MESGHFNSDIGSNTMTDNFSDILRNWIPEALDGNIEYFKQLKKHHILGQCKDKYGMTPLMYAVLGKGCFDRNLLSEFAKLCKKSARNCLGHTACDIYICIADPAVFSDAQYRDIFNVLDPSNTANKEAAANTAADVAAGVFAAGVAAFAAFTYFGADSVQRSNMDAAYRRKAEQARFSSFGPEIMPKDPTTKSESYREMYTSKFCTEQRDRLSHLEERQNSKEEELARLHTELENLNQSSGAIFREQCRKYAEARLSAYRKEREEQHQRLLNTEEKDEFEAQAEFQERIIQMMQKQFGPEAVDKELLKSQGRRFAWASRADKEYLRSKAEGNRRGNFRLPTGYSYDRIAVGFTKHLCVPLFWRLCFSWCIRCGK